MKMKSICRISCKLLIAIQVVGQLLTPTLAKAESEKDYWATTSLEASDLSNLLTTKRCYSSQDSFLGCVAAVNVLLSFGETPRALSNRHTSGLPEMKEVNTTVGSLEIRNIEIKQDKNKKFMEKWKENEATRDFSNAAWKRIYSETKIRPIEFGKLAVYALDLAKKEKLEQKIGLAINAFYSNSVDPHTYILPYAKQMDSLSKKEESFVGIGAMLEKVADSVLVKKPMEDSPALKAGLRQKDLITHVDDVSVAEIDIAEVVNKIKGPEGTTVTLTIQRGANTLKIGVVRGKITVKNIQAKLIKNQQTTVGYIKLNSFMQRGVCQEFGNLALRLKKEGAESLILDLRDNGGGLVDEALCMVSTYTDAKSELLTFRDSQTNKIIEGPMIDPDAALLYTTFGNKPLVVLVNSNSASASELLSGALQDYNRAVVVGEKSFGKGTVQTGARWEEKSSAPILINKTIGRFHLPSGRSNQLVGITPEFEVYSSPNPTEEDKFALREKDLYPNAIIPVDVPRQIDTASIQKIQTCISDRNLLENEYKESLESQTGPDYQLSYAKEVAVCL